MVAPVPAVVVDVVDCWVNSTTGVSPFLSSIRHCFLRLTTNPIPPSLGLRQPRPVDSCSTETRVPTPIFLMAILGVFGCLEEKKWKLCSVTAGTAM